MPGAEDDDSRRRFLLFSASSLLAACGAQPKAGCPNDAGMGAGLGYCLVDGRRLLFPGAAQMPVGSALLMNDDDNSAGVLVRDTGGFYGLSGICTHACCLVSLCRGVACSMLVGNPGSCAWTAIVTIPAAGPLLVCPCHGSEFAADGSVLKGPATRALPAVQVELPGGNDVIVDLSFEVPPSTRT